MGNVLFLFFSFCIIVYSGVSGPLLLRLFIIHYLELLFIGELDIQFIIRQLYTGTDAVTIGMKELR